MEFRQSFDGSRSLGRNSCSSYTETPSLRSLVRLGSLRKTTNYNTDPVPRTCQPVCHETYKYIPTKVYSIYKFNHLILYL